MTSDTTPEVDRPEANHATEDRELTPQDDAANILFRLETWFQHSLNGEIKGRQTGSGPTFNAYSYVEIPEWSMRQKLDDVQKIRASFREWQPIADALERCISAHCPDDKMFCGTCSPARELLAALKGTE